MKMIWDNWKQRWENALLACSKLGGRADELIIAAPATISEVERIETKIQLKLPESFRRVITRYSSSMQMAWFLPNEIELPKPFNEIFSGNCEWDLSALPELEARRKNWIEVCFPNPEKPYDKIWHNKLAFHAVDNGDMLAFDLSQGSFPVVYLSHDGDESHGYILGKNFEDFVDKWTQLGCPGTEDWQMLPFTHDSMSGLDPNCENARLWKKLFGLPVS
jgi:hypothetical protein